MLATLYKEDESKIHSLIAGVIGYIKKFTLFDNILPKSSKCKEPVLDAKTTDLFPTKIQVNKLSKSSAIPCSTEGHEELIKVENSDGSISWRLEHDSRTSSSTFSAVTSPFMTTGSSNAFSPLANVPFSKDSPAPLTKKDHDLASPNSLTSDIPDLPNPEFFDIGKDEEETSDSGSDKEKKKTYTCDYCGAEFRIRGYLTRHVKKHALTKAYECPFFDEHSENKCHPTGGFSRRDTYKTHLKARHFKYPQGTRSQDRSTTSGKCGICNKPYDSNEDWVEHHIENGECEGLPEGYTARVKNTRRKNYEYPIPTQISPVSSHSNDSPATNDGSPAVQHQQLNSAQDSIKLANALQKGRLQFSNGLINEYDNNDEFSLDVEQSLSFRPMMQYYTRV